MSKLAAFDRAWRETLSRELDQAAGAESRDRIMGDQTSLTEDVGPEAIYSWTLGMLERMDDLLAEPDRKRVLNACGCWMGPDGLRELKELYEETGDVDRVLDQAGGGLDRFLSDYGVSQAVIDEVNARGWG